MDECKPLPVTPLKPRDAGEEEVIGLRGAQLSGSAPAEAEAARGARKNAVAVRRSARRVPREAAPRGCDVASGADASVRDTDRDAVADECERERFGGAAAVGAAPVLAVARRTTSWETRPAARITHNCIAVRARFVVG